MIHYSPLPYEDIYPQSMESYDKIQMIQINGKLVLAERLEDGSYRIIRLLSTDPQHFLDGSVEPGTIMI
ncbi:YlzJ-like family protein [Bacillaceae bacterium S4-13-58]